MGDVLAARPDRLYEVRPQPGVLRHTGAHFVDFSPFVQFHDFPVPQMGGEQVVEFMRKLDSPVLDEQAGFRPGQGSPAADVEQIVGIPVPQRRLRSKSSLPGQGSTAYLEQVVVSRARGGPQGFLPGQGSSSSSRFPGGADDGFPGDFRTFFRPGKSARLGPHSGSELGADFTPSTPAPYVDGDMPPTWIDGDGLTWWQSESGRWYKARDPSIWWDDPG